jgi:hypothetical protein
MSNDTGGNKAKAVGVTDPPVNPSGSSLDKLKEWDPKGAELLLRVGMNPWSSGDLLHQDCGN